MNCLKKKKERKVKYLLTFVGDGQVVYIIGECMLPTFVASVNIYGHPPFENVSLPYEMV